MVVHLQTSSAQSVAIGGAAATGGDSVVHSPLELSTKSFSENPGGAPLLYGWEDAVAKSDRIPPLRPPRTNRSATARFNKIPPLKPIQSDTGATTEPNEIPPPKPPRTYKYYIPFEIAMHSQSPRKLAVIQERIEQENPEAGLHQLPTLGKLYGLPSSRTAGDGPSQPVSVYPSVDNAGLTCDQETDVPPIRPPRGIKHFKHNKTGVESSSTLKPGVESTTLPREEPFGQMNYNVTFHWKIPTSEVSRQIQRP